jgi:hypothetical protein
MSSSDPAGRVQSLLRNSLDDGRIFACRVAELRAPLAVASWREHEQRQLQQLRAPLQREAVLCVPLAPPPARRRRTAASRPGRSGAPEPPPQLPTPEKRPRQEPERLRGFMLRRLVPPEASSPLAGGALLPYQRVAPARAADLIGCKRQREALASYLAGPFAEGKVRDAAMLLLGPPGSGKTLTARLLLRESGFEVVEIGSHAAAATLARSIRTTSPKSIIGGRPAALFVEDFDALVEAEPGILEMRLLAPLVGTAPFLSSKVFGKVAHTVYFRPFYPNEAEAILARVMRCLAVRDMPPSHRADLVTESNGDARQLVLQASFLGGAEGGGGRDSVPSPFQLARDLAAGRGDPARATGYAALVLQENAPLVLDLEAAARFSADVAEADAHLRGGGEEAAAGWLAARFQSLPRRWHAGVQLRAPRAAAAVSRVSSARDWRRGCFGLRGGGPGACDGYQHDAA